MCILSIDTNYHYTLALATCPKSPGGTASAVNPIAPIVDGHPAGPLIH